MSVITKIKHFLSAFFYWLRDPEGFTFLKLLIWLGFLFSLAWLLASTPFTRGIFVIYLYCSCVVFFYKFIIKDKKFWCIGEDKRNWVDYLVLIGTWIGLLIISIKATSAILFFIPESWGEIDEDGEWRSLKVGVCFWTGVLLVSLLMVLLSKYVSLWHRLNEKK